MIWPIVDVMLAACICWMLYQILLLREQLREVVCEQLATRKGKRARRELTAEEKEQAQKAVAQESDPEVIAANKARGREVQEGCRRPDLHRR